MAIEGDQKQFRNVFSLRENIKINEMKSLLKILSSDSNRIIQLYLIVQNESMNLFSNPMVLPVRTLFAIILG